MIQKVLIINIIFFNRLYIYLLCCYVNLFTYNCFLQLYCSSKDILMRVVAHNLSPELTLVEKVCLWKIILTCLSVFFECWIFKCCTTLYPLILGVFDFFSNLPILKVMTPNPECATVETTILDALHIMHDGKFLHLPVLDRGENFSQNLNSTMWIYHKHPSSGKNDANHQGPFVWQVFQWNLRRTFNYLVCSTNFTFSNPGYYCLRNLKPSNMSFLIPCIMVGFLCLGDEQ